ncbi:MAG: hypothetical protein E7613_04145 [Ruminococcaceae bacterium]|nr:hypothetical protein [Oscillospiraceae bacterium]
MIKGANRRIVIMKDTGSDYFEQAFFLVKENQLKNKKEPILEAKKVLGSLEADQKKKSILSPFRLFLAGCLVGLALGFWI